MIDEEVKTSIFIRALENAVKFDGKANPKAVLGKLLSEKPELKNSIKELISLVDETVNKVNAMSVDEQFKALKDYGYTGAEEKKKKEEKTLPPLPNADKYPKVTMRIAPYPSGPLHIGNARMVILNDEYAKMYNGELLLVYDDTIGSEYKVILPEAYDYIKEGLDWLGVKISKVFYKSDRLPIFYEWCEKLISKGEAYVCTCNPDTWRQEYKLKMKPCPCRSRTVTENLELWDKMLNGHFKEGEAAVRLKSGMDIEDPALRDHVIMRISYKTHPRVGDKYIVWPLLEFSWAIDDYLLGITHILRGKDLIKEDKVEKIIWDKIGVKGGEFIHYGRIRFQGLSLSKSKSAKNVREGVYFGWRDPRTWSLQSLMARGIRPEAIRDAILDLGLSLSDIEYSPEILYSFNRRIIDKNAKRLFFVDNPTQLIIEDVNQDILTAHPPVHPDFPELGNRNITVKVDRSKAFILLSKRDTDKMHKGDRLRLKDLCNIEVLDVGEVVTGRLLSLGLEDGRSAGVTRIIHWVPQHENIPVNVIMTTGEITSGFAEKEAEKLKVDDIIQFERFGFVRVDEIKTEEAGKPLITVFYTHN